MLDPWLSLLSHQLLTMRLLMPFLVHHGLQRSPISGQICHSSASRPRSPLGRRNLLDLVDPVQKLIACFDALCLVWRLRPEALHPRRRRSQPRREHRRMNGRRLRRGSVSQVRVAEPG